MFKPLKRLLDYIAYNTYDTLIWMLVLHLTYKWHINDYIDFNLNIHMLVGIVLIFKMMANLNVKLYPKDYDPIQTGYLQVISPYAILLISFMFKCVLRFWT